MATTHPFHTTPQSNLKRVCTFNYAGVLFVCLYEAGNSKTAFSPHGVPVQIKLILYQVCGNIIDNTETRPTPQALNQIQSHIDAYFGFFNSTVMKTEWMYRLVEGFLQRHPGEVDNKLTICTVNLPKPKGIHLVIRSIA